MVLSTNLSQPHVESTKHIAEEIEVLPKRSVVLSGIIRDATKTVKFSNTRSSARSTWQQFLENTSLVGVQQFLRRKSIIWLVSYLVCVALSILQSWSVTVTFFEQRTYHMETIASKELMAFPSVTVCTNVVLKEDFNFSLIPNFNYSVHQQVMEHCPNSRPAKDWSAIIENNRKAVQQYLRTVDNKARKNMSLNLSDFVSECNLGRQQCNFSDPNSIFVFNHPFFGNCFTFNPAFDDHSTKLTKFHEMLQMTFQLQRKGYKLMPYYKPMVTVRIHPPGSAPLLQPPESQIVFSGQKAIMALELSETTVFRKWSQSIPSCVGINDLTYRKRSRYYQTSAPYKYSLEACMKSCEQDYIGKRCNIVNPYLVLQSTTYEQDKTASFVADCVLEQPLTMESCDCPLSCVKTDYHIIRQDVDLDNIPCAGAMQPNYENPAKEQDYQNSAVINIFYRSHIYVKLEEHLSYSVSDYLGILGGNMSLWIGLCVVSVLEVVELGTRVAFDVLRISPKNQETRPPSVAVFKRM